MTPTANATQDRNYYFVRSCRSIPLTDGVVGIGWDDMVFSDFADAELLLTEMYNKGWDISGRHANQIRRFKNIRSGDLIVVPLWGTAALASALGEEFYDEKYYEEDGCNQHRVRFPMDAGGEVKLVPRANLSEALQRRLRVRGVTVGDLAEFKEELDSAFAMLTSGQDYSWSSVIAQKEEALADAVKARLLMNIREGRTGLCAGGTGLEHLVKELLRVDGFNAEVLAKATFPGSGDADIKASKVHPVHSDNFLVQVKHHNWTTGRWGQEQLLEIQKLMPDEYKDYHLVLVTSGDVSEEDKEFAKQNKVTVLDGRDLAEWIYDALRKLSPEITFALGVSMIPQVIG